MYFVEQGQNGDAPVVFIHGFPFNHSIWSEQLRALEKVGRHSIAYDVRGHGRSPLPRGPVLVDFLVDDLIQLLDERGIKKAVLCGLSMGGYVALRAYERFSSRVAGLVLCDTRAQAETDEGKGKRADSIRFILERGVEPWAKVFVQSLFTKPSFERNLPAIDEVKAMILATPAETIAAFHAALAARTDSTALLSKISVPTLVIVGEQDSVTPVENAQFMAARIPGAHLEVVPGAGHLSCMENPSSFNESLLQFLRRPVALGPGESYNQGR